MEDNSQTCGELAEHFQISDETVRLHLHCMKVYKLSKFVRHTLSEGQHATMSDSLSPYFLGTATYSYLIVSSLVTKSGSCMTLQVFQTLIVTTGPCASHHKDYLYINAKSCSISGVLVENWCTMICYQQAKQSLRTCPWSSWNICNRD